MAMALIDLQSSTPLDPADSIIMLPHRREQQGGSRYFVVKRRILEALVKTIQNASGKLLSVKLHTEHGDVEMDAADYRHMTRQAKRDVLVRKFAVISLTACFGGAVGTFAHAQWRYIDGSNQLDGQIEAFENDAKEVRDLLSKRRQQAEQITSIRIQKKQATPVTTIWGELTRVIPDTSWVSDVSIKDGQVRISGFSRSAAGLISMLEGSPLFAGPTFGAPVVKAPDVDKERFSIDMELQR